MKLQWTITVLICLSPVSLAADEHAQRAQSPPVKAGLASEYKKADSLHSGRRIPAGEGRVLQQTRTIAIQLPSGTKITAEVADTPSKRLVGLMFRDQLPHNQGMLFIFENTDFHGIWMKNCRIPLDILWLDQSRKVIHTEENVPPCQFDPCHIYYPLQKALYVLELNTGLIAKEKIRLGAHIQF